MSQGVEFGLQAAVLVWLLLNGKWLSALIPACMVGWYCHQVRLRPAFSSRPEHWGRMDRDLSAWEPPGLELWQDAPFLAAPTRRGLKSGSSAPPAACVVQHLSWAPPPLLPPNQYRHRRHKVDVMEIYREVGPRKKEYLWRTVAHLAMFIICLYQCVVAGSVGGLCDVLKRAAPQACLGRSTVRFEPRRTRAPRGWSMGVDQACHPSLPPPGIVLPGILFPCTHPPIPNPLFVFTALSTSF